MTRFIKLIVLEVSLKVGSIEKIIRLANKKKNTGGNYIMAVQKRLKTICLIKFIDF